MNVTAQLLKRCQVNQRQAQHELYKECYHILLPIGFRYLKNKNDAIAALNKTFIKLLDALDSYSHNQNFGSWAKRIMVNTCIDELRKKTNHERREYPFDPSDYVYKNGSINWNEAESKLGVEDILELVQALPDKTRQVFNLYVMEGYAHKDIAGMLSVSEGTSKWHLAKARKELQSKLKQRLLKEKVATNAS